MSSISIAKAFHDARLSAVKLEKYPGEVPSSLEQAYEIQDIAISRWPALVVGWKVAVILPEWRQTYTAPRFAGPVFANGFSCGAVSSQGPGAIEGGFCAVEAEFVVKIRRDIPSDLHFDKAENMLPFVESVHAGIELAGSPLASINDVGPGAAVSDFGNSMGIVVGDQLTHFGRDGWEKEGASIFIDDVEIGRGTAANVPGGPLEAVLFLVSHLATRGRIVRAGDWISTGAATGVHKTKAGSRIRAHFNAGASVSMEIGHSQPVT